MILNRRLLHQLRKLYIKKKNQQTWHSIFDNKISKTKVNLASTPMQKRFYQLLIKQQRSASQNQQIIEIISNKYIKSLITVLPIQKILQHIKIQSWPSQTTIYNQGDKVQNYYFLIQGSVNLYKKNKIGQQEFLEISKNVSGLTFIGDTFFIHNILHSHTAVTSDSIQSKGFLLQKSQAQQLCSILVKQYKTLKNYFCDFLKISTERLYKVDLYQNLTIKSFNYGQKITTNDQIFIIYEGQCLMKFQQKSPKKIKKQLPYKSKNSKSQVYRPLLKLCSNQCLGMQKLFKQQTQTANKIQHKSFSYIATSQKLICICISINNIALYPQQLRQKLKIIHQSHLQKLEDNIYYKKQIQDSNHKAEFTFFNSNQSKDRFSIGPSFKQNSFSLNNSQLKSTINQSESSSILISDVTNTTDNVKAKFKNLNSQNLKTQKMQQFTNKMPQKQKKSFRFPKVFINNKKYQQQNQSYFSRLNKTQTFSPSISPLKVSSVNLNDILQLKKRFCVGYDLKNKCDRESVHYKDKDQLQIIKQPKGYFVFSRNKNKENNINQRQQRKGRKTHNSPHRQWSQYIKLPRIIQKINKQT